MSVSRSFNGQIKFKNSIKEKIEITVNNRNLIENNKKLISNRDNDSYDNSNNIEKNIYKSNSIILKSIENDYNDDENTEIDNEKENFPYRTEENKKMKNKQNENENRDNSSCKSENENKEENKQNHENEENYKKEGNRENDQYSPNYPTSDLLASTITNSSKSKLQLKLRAPSSDVRLQWISWLLKVNEENN